MLDVSSFDLNAIGPEFIDNPYPVLRALRERAPVLDRVVSFVAAGTA